MDTLTIIKPDDMHLHLRDGAEMASVVGDSARRFARAIIMPNLRPPVVNVVQALAYRQRILDCLDERLSFEPLMTLYLTDDTAPDEIRRAAESQFVRAVKLYPAGATTHSDAGVTKLENVYPVLEALVEHGMPLLVHGEVTDADVDVFDGEAAYIDRCLAPLLGRLPGLRIVFEHITTRRAVEFVESGPENLAATVTVHHLMYNRGAMFREGLRPHLYCLPLLKTEEDRRALLSAATGGNPRFFLGTDSAPHARTAKESDCGCAGIYSACAATELYAQVFEAAGALDRLEAFASLNGARFYGLPPGKEKLTLHRDDWRLPESLPFGRDTVVPIASGQTCRWKLHDR